MITAGSTLLCGFSCRASFPSRQPSPCKQWHLPSIPLISHPLKHQNKTSSASRCRGRLSPWYHLNLSGENLRRTLKRCNVRCSVCPYWKFQGIRSGMYFACRCLTPFTARCLSESHEHGTSFHHCVSHRNSIA